MTVSLIRSYVQSSGQTKDKEGKPMGDDCDESLMMSVDQEEFDDNQQHETKMMK